MSMNNHKSAAGKIVNMDKLVLENEEVVAIGNRNVNARGDELGARGVVVKPKGQVMKEYYDLEGSVKAAPDFNKTVIAERERARSQRAAEKGQK